MEKRERMMISMTESMSLTPKSPIKRGMIQERSENISISIPINNKDWATWQNDYFEIKNDQIRISNKSIYSMIIFSFEPKGKFNIFPSSPSSSP